MELQIIENFNFITKDNNKELGEMVKQLTKFAEENEHLKSQLAMAQVQVHNTSLTMNDAIATIDLKDRRIGALMDEMDDLVETNKKLRNGDGLA